MDTPIYNVNLEQFEEPTRNVMKRMLEKLVNYERLICFPPIAN